MYNLNSLLLNTSDLDSLATFYEKVFGKPADMKEEGYVGWQVGNTFFSIGFHSEVSGAAPTPRLFFNLETKSVQSEFNRLQDLGATVVKEPYQLSGMWIATLADPDGNYFQLITPWEDSQNQELN